MIISDKENREYSKRRGPGKIPLSKHSKKIPLQVIDPNTNFPNLNITESPILVCQRFQEPIWLGFGCVPIGESSEKGFQLSNPEQEKVVKVQLSSAPEAKGFQVFLGQNNDREVLINGSSSIPCKIVWKPYKNMSVREEVELMINESYKLFLTIHGISGIGEAKDDKLNKQRKTLTRSHSSQDLSAAGKTSMDPKQVGRRRDQSRSQSPAPRNLHGAQDWLDRQEQNLAGWLNSKFALSDLYDGEPDTSMPSEIDITDSGLVALQQQRAQLQQRVSCLRVLNNEDLQGVISSMETEVERGRLSLRDDQDVHADVFLREKFVRLLLCYEGPWLRVALEVLFQQPTSTLPPRCSEARVRAWVKTVISERILSDQSTVDKYVRNGRMTVSVRDQSLRQELGQHLLKTFLTIVLLLDRCRLANILPSGARLFQKGSPVRSSRAVLEAFARDFLKGEGLVVKHLSQFGYHVDFEQTFIDEFDFAVRETDLSSDLRDGVRLARLVEILTATPFGELCNGLRVPAVSRLQKIHNVGLVLQKLRSCGVALDVEAKNLVDGKREQVVGALWKLLFSFEVSRIISEAAIREEVLRVQQSYSWKRSVYIAEDARALAVIVPVREKNGIITFPGEFRPDRSGRLSEDKPPLQQGQKREAGEAALTDALVDWCDAIAGQYGAAVNNLTTSLADGRALCLLVHYYHPSILPTKLIRKTSTHTCSSSLVSRSEKHQAVDGEHRNFSLLRQACSEIGGIPLSLPSYDSRNIPDERFMTVFLSFLFARLIESSNEIRAVIRIQRAVRNSLGRLRSQRRRAEELREKRNKAVNDRVPVAVFDGKASVRPALLSPEFSGSSVHGESGGSAEGVVLVEGSVSSVVEVLDAIESTVDISDALSHVPTAEFPMESCGLQITHIVELEEPIDVYTHSETETTGVAAAATAVVISDAEGLSSDCDRGLEEPSFHQEDLPQQSFETADDAKESLERREVERRDSLETETRLRQLQDELSERTLREAETLAMTREDMTCLKSEGWRKAEEAALRMRLELELQAQRAIEEKNEAIYLERRSKIEMEEKLRNMEQELVMERRRNEIEKQEIAVAVENEVAARTAREQTRQDLLAQLEGERTELRDRLERIRVEAEERLEAERISRVAAERKAEEEARAKKDLLQRLSELEAREEQRRLQEESVQRKALNNAARTIQCAWRGLHVHMKYRKIHTAAVGIQRAIRKWIHRRRRVQLVSAVAKLCVWWRRTYFRVMAVRRLELQRNSICEKERTQNLQRAVHATLIQSLWRRSLVRKTYLHTLQSITLVQSLVRRCSCIQYFRLCLRSVGRIQKHFRSYRVRCEEWRCKQLVQLKQRVVLRARALIVSHWRSYRKHKTLVAAVAKIEGWMAAYFPLMRARKMNRGFRRLQALYRAAKVRRTSSRRVAISRQRILKANLTAKANPAMALGRRTAAALSMLRSGKMISHYIQACQTLLTSTTYSQKCCFEFAQTSASSIMFELIRSCNRSTPHQELLRYCLAVLLNVARHADLAASVAKATHAADTLIDLLQMFRDKKSIFCQTAEILCSLVAADRELQSQCNAHEFRKRIDGIFHIVERKHRLEVRVTAVNTKTGGKTPRVAGSPVAEISKNGATLAPIDFMNRLMSILQ